jgi:hypothetical protein
MKYRIEKIKVRAQTESGIPIPRIVMDYEKIIKKQYPDVKNINRLVAYNLYKRKIVSASIVFALSNILESTIISYMSPAPIGLRFGPYISSSDYFYNKHHYNELMINILRKRLRYIQLWKTMV